MQRHYDVFDVPGIYIDYAYSSYHTVYLSLVDPTTFGVYRCQVSNEFPVFDTISKTVMAAIPTGSIITPATHSYVAVSDPVQLNCSIFGSFPKLTITWHVNTVAIVSPEARDDYKYHNSVIGQNCNSAQSSQRQIQCQGQKLYNSPQLNQPQDPQLIRKTFKHLGFTFLHLLNYISIVWMTAGLTIA